jgi:hypothetical protein
LECRHYGRLPGWKTDVSERIFRTYGSDIICPECGAGYRRVTLDYWKGRQYSAIAARPPKLTALATLDRCRLAMEIKQALPSFAGIDPVNDDTIASKP